MQEIPVNDNEEQRLRQLGVEIDMSMYTYMNYRFPKGESTIIDNPKTLFRAIDWDRVTDESGYIHEVHAEFCHHLKLRERGTKKEVVLKGKQLLTEEGEDDRETSV